MDKNRQYFEQLCEPAFLIRAWKQVRINRGAAGVDQVSIYEYERDLAANIRDLSARLREGRYLPMPFLHFEMQKANGKSRKLGIGTVEDRIVARALHDLLESLWEPVFLDCSYGFRPGRNAEMAVKRVLDYRAAGDVVVVDADLQDCFDSLDHEIVLGLISQRIRDKRLLGLIRMMLATGAASPAEPSTEAPVIDRIANFAASAANDAVCGMLSDPGLGYANYGAYDPVPSSEDSGDLAAQGAASARREAMKRLGRDALLLGLTYVGRSRRARLAWMLSPTTFALAGAAALATAAYPAAARWMRGRRNKEAAGVGAVQGSAFSPLLANIILHEFDRQMMRAGFHLVRYADDWVVTAQDAETAERALQFAARVLADLRLSINPAKTRILRFESGLEFVGYRFDPFLLTATPPPASTQPPIRVALTEASAALREKAVPALSRYRKQAIELGREGISRVTNLIRPSRRS